jgi:hypothetical protein
VLVDVLLVILTTAVELFVALAAYRSLDEDVLLTGALVELDGACDCSSSL